MKNSVYVALVFEVDLDKYYSSGGDANFIDKLASTLNVHPSQFKIVGVKKGSTIVEFFILPSQPTDSTGNQTQE